MKRKTHSKAVFDHLKGIYSASSEYMKVVILSPYHAFKLRRDEPPTAAFMRLTTITRSLESLSHKISDKDFIAKFLSILPYKDLRSCSPGNQLRIPRKPKKDYLLTHLQFMEQIAKEDDTPQPASAYYANSNGGRRNNFRNGRGNSRPFNRDGGHQQGNRNGKRCYNCYSTEPLARNCDQTPSDNNRGGNGGGGGRNSNNGSGGQGGGNGNHNNNHQSNGNGGNGNNNGNWNRNSRGRGKVNGNWKHKSSNTRAFHANADQQKAHGNDNAPQDEGHCTSYSLFGVDFFTTNAHIEAERGPVFEELESDNESLYEDAVEEIGQDAAKEYQEPHSLVATEVKGEESLDFYQLSAACILHNPTTTITPEVGGKAIVL